MQKETFGIWPNMGQVVSTQGAAVPGVKFYTTGAVPRAYFRKDGSFSLVLATGDSLGPDTLRRLDITCVGGNAQYPQPVVWQMKSQYAHFYLPQCGPGGAQFVHPYHRVLYPGVYPHIDMHIYSGKVGQKLAFVINPGGDPKDITLQFQGQEQMDVDIYGNLKLLIAGKWITIPEAMAYQVADNGSIIPVNWTAAFNAYESIGRAYFQFDAYDHAKPLIFLIGPPALGGVPPYEEYGLCWSTYFGGDRYDHPKDIKPDNAGNFYVAGRTESTWSTFPYIPGTTTSVIGTSVATLTKFSAGHQLMWTIYQGGGPDPNGYSTAAAVAVKNNPVRVYIGGQTRASDFFTYTMAGAYNQAAIPDAGDQGFIARYDGNSGQIQWSTCIGLEQVRVQAVCVMPGTDMLAIAGTAADTLYLPNRLPPANGHHFYRHGGSDAFVAVLNEHDNVYWSALYGGSQDDLRGLVRASKDRIVLAGNTESSGIPLVAGTDQSLQESFHGGTDIFIAQFSIAGQLNWATYLGGPGVESLAPQGIGIQQVGDADDLFLTGSCGHLSTLVNGPNWHDSSAPPTGMNGVLARFSRKGVPKWITYLGHGTDHSPWCLYVNNPSSITVGGYTNDTQFEFTQWPGHYFQNVYYQDPDTAGVPRSQDCFLVRFNGEQQRIYATLFGGNAGTSGEPENITAVQDIGASTYAVGYTSKPHGQPAAYFPLAGDVNGSAYFNPLFNYNGLSDQWTDGFITEFCNELVTSIAAPVVPEGMVRAGWKTSADFMLYGLADGLHQVQLFDAQGRLVLESKVHSASGRSEGIALQGQGAALYMVVVDHCQSTKLAAIR